MTKTDELRLLGRFQMVLGGISLLGLIVLLLASDQMNAELTFASLSVVSCFALWLFGSGWGILRQHYAGGFIAGSLLGVTAILFGGIPPFGFPGLIYGCVLTGLLLLRYRPLFHIDSPTEEDLLLGKEFDPVDEEHDAEHNGNEKP